MFHLLKIKNCMLKRFFREFPSFGLLKYFVMFLAHLLIIFVIYSIWYFMIYLWKNGI